MSDFSLISTPDLRALEAQLENGLRTLTGQALTDCEARYESVVEELEYRLSHIAIRGTQVRVRFDHFAGQVLACTDQNKIGSGADAWAARNELEQLLEAM